MRPAPALAALLLAAAWTAGWADETDDFVNGFADEADASAMKTLEHVHAEKAARGAEIEERKATDRRRTKAAEGAVALAAEAEARLDAVLAPGDAPTWEPIPERVAARVGHWDRVTSAAPCAGPPRTSASDYERPGAGGGRDASGDDDANREEARRTAELNAADRRRAEDDARGGGTRDSEADIQGRALGREAADNRRRLERSQQANRAAAFRKFKARCQPNLDFNLPPLLAWLDRHEGCSETIARVEKGDLSDRDAIKAIIAVDHVGGFTPQDHRERGEFKACLSSLMPKSRAYRSYYGWSGVQSSRALVEKARLLRQSRKDAGRWFPSQEAYEWALALEKRAGAGGSKATSEERVRHHNIVRRMKLYDPFY